MKDLSEARLKTEFAKLQRELNAAYKTIDKLINDARKKEEEIKHLKSMLEQNVPVLIEHKKPQTVIEFDLSPEEEIAEIQLQKLRQVARQRSLTLEETRQYDLLVKNKRLSQEQATINVGATDYKRLDADKLMQIAESKKDSDGNKS